MVKTAEDFLAWCRQRRGEASAALARFECGELRRWSSGASITGHQIAHLRRIIVRLDRLIEDAENA